MAFLFDLLSPVPKGQARMGEGKVQSFLLEEDLETPLKRCPQSRCGHRYSWFGLHGPLEIRIQYFHVLWKNWRIYQF